MYGQPNYYGNQYFAQPMQYRQPMQQPQLQQPMQTLDFNKPVGLQGKSVDNIDVVKAMDIPLDGSISYFPIADGSAIITKQLQQDGTSKTLVYKLSNDNVSQETKKYITEDELNNAISKINTSDWKEEVKTIKKQIKELMIDFDEIKDRKD